MQVAGQYEPLKPGEGSLNEEPFQGAKSPDSRVEQVNSEGLQISQDMLNVRYPIRLKVTVPYLIFALVIAMIGAYVVTRIVFDTIEERFTNQLIAIGQRKFTTIIYTYAQARYHPFLSPISYLLYIRIHAAE